jgi:hypothetical protein
MDHITANVIEEIDSFLGGKEGREAEGPTESLSVAVSTYLLEEFVNIVTRPAIIAEIEGELCDRLGRDQEEENLKGRAAACYIIHAVSKP